MFDVGTHIKLNRHMLTSLRVTLLLISFDEQDFKPPRRVHHALTEMGCGSSLPKPATLTGPAGDLATLQEKPPQRVRRRSNSFLGPETDESTDFFDLPVPPTHLGFYSNCGFKNARTINQDRAMVTYPLAGDTSQMLLGVYDGHGADGHQISERVANHLSELIESHAEDQSSPASCSKALERSLVSTDDW